MFCSEGNQSQWFIMGGYLKMKALKKKNIKMKALRKIVLLIFNASKITDIDIVLKHNLSLVFF